MNFHRVAKVKLFRELSRETAITQNQKKLVIKDEIAARKVLVKMFAEISQQTLLLGEQNAQMDRNQKGLK